jgi:hypothetical protein
MYGRQSFLIKRTIVVDVRYALRITHHRLLLLTRNHKLMQGDPPRQTQPAIPQFMGVRIKRREDPALITGQGKYYG